MTVLSIPLTSTTSLTYSPAGTNQEITADIRIKTEMIVNV